MRLAFLTLVDGHFGLGNIPLRTCIMQFAFLCGNMEFAIICAGLGDIICNFSYLSRIFRSSHPRLPKRDNNRAKDYPQVRQDSDAYDSPGQRKPQYFSR